MPLTLDGTNGITQSASFKSNTYLDAAGGNTATINGIIPGKPLFGTSQTISSNKTLTIADNYDLLVVTSPIKLTLPNPTSGYVFGIIVSQATHIIITAPSSSTKIGRYSKSVKFTGYKQLILSSDGTDWQTIGAETEFSLLVKSLSTGTYTPPATCTGFLVMAVGATSGPRTGTNIQHGACGGGGYSEKFYAAPFTGAPYSVTIGAGGISQASPTLGGTTTFGPISIACSPTTAGTGGAGGIGTGGDYNATGGSGGTGGTSNYGGAGGGGSASRAGNGGNGGSNPVASDFGGGGTGGNHASGTTPGAAATTTSASAYDLSVFLTAPTFCPGFSGDGASGAMAYQTSKGETLFLMGSAFVPGPGSAKQGGGYGFNYNSFQLNGYAGAVSVLEFY